MIKVIYHRHLNRVSVTGHANSGEKGHDLVCASASILAYTLAAFVNNMKNAEQVRNVKVQLNEGDALICCETPRKYKASVTLVFDSVCGGFDLLAKHYPEYISFEIRGS